MAQYVAVPSHAKFHIHNQCLKERFLVPQSMHIQLKRKCASGKSKVMQLSSWNACKHSFTHFTNLAFNFCREDRSMRCYCLGTLISLDDATSDWIPILNQVLLMTSIFLTYMAGVIPADKSIRNSQKSILGNHIVPEDISVAGSVLKNDDEVNLKFAWDVVERKLLDSMDAVKCGISLGEKTIESEQNHARRPSNLYAVAEGPRLRLLWTSFQCLKKEVDNISSNSNVSVDDWLIPFCEMLEKSYQAVLLAWLEAELCLINGKHDKALLLRVSEKLNGYETMLEDLRKLGKEGLYAELIFLLRFDSLREGFCYDYKLFSKHGISILEDLLITLADGIASMYLELVSVDGHLSYEIHSLGLSLCTLSTRELQRLRNKIALNHWLHQNIETIVSMYEDRFDLCTLQNQIAQEHDRSENENFSWWKKLILRNSGPDLSPLRYVVITSISIPVKRTKELRSLIGWRYYFSLFLELADITVPLIKNIIAKVTDAISFFLVCLIGRSLGLIYTGIRQSLRWK